MQNKIGTIWLVGAGNMGGALARKWLESGKVQKLITVDPNPVPLPDGAEGRKSCASYDGSGDAVVIAVKPNIAAEALADLAPRLSADTPVISVMAGATLSTLRAILPVGELIRAMPNTPAQVGKGMTGLFSNDASPASRTVAESLFGAVGDAVWLSQESDFDALTALSGSGPAYVFRMVEALAAAGEAAGLEAELAQKLARATVVGAGALLESDERTAGELRRAVTSPGGTTEAGLGALDEDPGLPALVRNAVRAAAQRSRELGG